MARRYSGDLVITITWDDVRNRYIGKVNVMNQRKVQTFQVTTPVNWKTIDSPETYDEAARTLLAFAAKAGWPVNEYAEFEPIRYAIRRQPKLRQIK